MPSLARLAFVCCVCAHAASYAQERTVTRHPPAPPYESDRAATTLQSDAEVLGNVMRTAREAIYCGIRSDGWFSSLSTGIEMGFDEELHKLELQAIDRRSFSFYVQTIRTWIGRYSLSAFPSRSDCLTLMASPEMQKLDAIEYAVTGGYH